MFVEKIDICSRESAVTSGSLMSMRGYIMSKYEMVNIGDVYHYTDMNGFISIIQNRELWLSHIRFMNDRKEYLDGRELCKEVINELTTNKHSMHEEFLNIVLKNLENEISTGFFARSSKDVFSLSLSRSRDSLDMWRGYGQSSGIAIGFEGKASMQLPGFAMMRKEQYEEELKKHENNPEKMVPRYERLLLATNILYEEEKKKMVLYDILDVVVEHLEYLQSRNVKWAEDSALDCATSMLFDIFPYFKNKGFRNEDECRIVENFTYSQNDVPLKIYYRERNGLILPYIKYVMLDRNCRPLKEWPIKEIVVGPGLKQKDSVESVKYFLEKQGMNDLVEKVVTSDIPYISN